MLTARIWATWLISLYAVLDKVESWPGGTYELPMPKSGCPNATTFHWYTGLRIQATEPGNKVSPHLHLAGRFEDSLIEQKFCMKMSLVQDGGSKWMRGEYCIYQKGSCPSGFGSGFIYWDDASSWLSDDHLRRQKGILPAGEYGANTKINFCCRSDGKYYKPITLPVTAAFYLFKHAKHCQKVVGMSVKEEWVLWKDESSINMNGQKWPHPSLERPQGDIYTKLFFCYYEPLSQGNNNKTIEVVVSVLVSVISLILIIIVMCFFAKRCSRKRYENEAVTVETSAQSPRRAPHVLQTQCSEIGVNTEVTNIEESIPMMHGLHPEDGANIEQPPSYDEVMSQQNSQNEHNESSNGTKTVA